MLLRYICLFFLGTVVIQASEIDSVPSSDISEDEEIHTDSEHSGSESDSTTAKSGSNSDEDTNVDCKMSDNFCNLSKEYGRKLAELKTKEGKLEKADIDELGRIRQHFTAALGDSENNVEKELSNAITHVADGENERAIITLGKLSLEDESLGVSNILDGLLEAEISPKVIGNAIRQLKGKEGGESLGKHLLTKAKQLKQLRKEENKEAKLKLQQEKRNFEEEENALIREQESLEAKKRKKHEKARGFFQAKTANINKEFDTKKEELWTKRAELGKKHAELQAAMRSKYDRAYENLDELFKGDQYLEESSEVPKKIAEGPPKEESKTSPKEESKTSPKVKEFDISALNTLNTEMEGLLPEIKKTGLTAKLLEKIRNIYRDSIKKFFNGNTIHFKEEDQFFHLPQSILISMAMYNETVAPLSGLPYVCALALKESSYNGTCDELMVQLYTFHGLKGGREKIQSELVPDRIIDEIKERYTKAVSEAKKQRAAELGHRRRRSVDEDNDDDDYDGERGRSELFATTSSGENVTPNASITPTSSTVPFHTAKASAKVSPNAAAAQKLTGLIKGGTPISLDTFTGEELSLLCNEPTYCLRLLGSVRSEDIHLKEKLLKDSVCKGTEIKGSAEKLPDGPLKDAWTKVCGVGGTGFGLWVIIGIITVVIVAMAIGGVVYFMFQRQ